MDYDSSFFTYTMMQVILIWPHIFHELVQPIPLIIILASISTFIIFPCSMSYLLQEEELAGLLIILCGLHP